MIKRDNEIYKWLVSKNPPSLHFDPIQKAWEQGDSSIMYQTMLGNWGWCKENQCPLDLLEVEKLAGGIGKIWYYNGPLLWVENYKNGVKL